MIANNYRRCAARIGIAVVNFNEGGRLATVQGNFIRNLKNKRPAGTDPNYVAGIAHRGRGRRRGQRQRDRGRADSRHQHRLGRSICVTYR